jgi:hypothetical protein
MAANNRRVSALSNLLREIEAEHPDTKVTVARPLTWTYEDQSFADFEVSGGSVIRRNWEGLGYILSRLTFVLGQLCHR